MKRLAARCVSLSAASMARRVLADHIGDDGLAVADRVAAVDDVGKLAARRLRGVEDVLVRERHAGELEEGIDLEPVAVVVGDAEQGGIGVEAEHGSASGGAEDYRAGWPTA